MRKSDFVSLRNLIFNRFTVQTWIETGPVFSDVRDTWCLISVIKNQPDGSKKEHKIHHLQLSRFTVSVEERLSDFANVRWASDSYVNQGTWKSNEQFLVGYLTNETSQALIQKMDGFRKLGEFEDEFRISRGEEGGKTAFFEKTDGDWFMMTPEEVYQNYHEEGKKIDSKDLTKGKLEQFYSKSKIWVIRIQKLRWVQRIVSAFDERRNSASMKTLQLIVSSQNDVERLKILQCILSSKLINFWCINFLSDDMNSSYLASIPIPFERFILFPNFKEVARKSFDLRKSYFQVKKHFLALLQAELGLAAPSRTLENWETLDPAAFLAELAKQKISLSLAQKSEWLGHFEQQRARALSLLADIQSTDRQIDDMVFDLYGLTPEERALVRG